MIGKMAMNSDGSFQHVGMKPKLGLDGPQIEQKRRQRNQIVGTTAELDAAALRIAPNISIKEILL